MGKFAKSFLLFKGVLMDSTQLLGWTSKIMLGYSKMSGITSAYRSLETALEFAQCDRDDLADNHAPALFVFSMRNYHHFGGFRLTDSRYSAYPSEQEYLLWEDIEYYILDVL